MNSTKLLMVVGGTLAAGAAFAQMGIVNNIAGTFVDISASGTALGDGDDNSFTFVSTVGNAYFAAGNTRVSTNGVMSFNNTLGNAGFTNNAIPGAGAVPNSFGNVQQLFPFWDDLLVDPGELRWQEISNVLIVQWTNVGTFTGGGPGTFQIKVYGSAPYAAQMLYGNALPGATTASATIGYADGLSGENSGNNLPWSFNTAGAVAPGSVLTIVPEPGTFIALGLGLAGLALARRRRK